MAQEAKVFVMLREGSNTVECRFADRPDVAGRVVLEATAEATMFLENGRSIWNGDDPATFTTPTEPDGPAPEVDLAVARVDQMLADNVISVNRHAAIMAVLAL